MKPQYQSITVLSNDFHTHSLISEPKMNGHEQQISYLAGEYIMTR